MKTIGKYHIRGLLGRGGMGAVYKVLLPVAGRIVALKVLDPAEPMRALMGMDKIKQRFIAEAGLMASLGHPHLARVLDYDTDQTGRPFYTMDYYCLNLGMLIGETYEDAPSRALTVHAAARYLDQVLSGLARLHHAGIVHRDLKPVNVMLTPEDNVKIIDLGMYRLRGETDRFPDGMIIGTPFYTAPEQEADSEAANELSDIFSAGALAWRLLTGTPPPEKFTEQNRASAIRSDLTPGWDEFLIKALSPDPGERHQSARDMRAELDRLYKDWREHLDRACLIHVPAQKSANHPGEIRLDPVKIAPRQAKDFFPVDQLWRPKTWSAEKYRDNGDGTVLDQATGLTWQRSGSEYSMTWNQAHDYVREINEETRAGRSNWRLPTVDELLTLLTAPETLGDYCSSPVFDRNKTRLWSADRRSFMAAWFVDAGLGFTSWQDFTCRFFVRAVSRA